MATQHYDAVVIGAGQAGVPLATTLAKAGRKTALVEREHVGGTCINEGCTPTKTMVASAKVAYFDRRSRSEEHTSELQSRQYLVCRLLLEKKNKDISYS